MFLSLCDTESPACVLLTDSKFGAAFFEHRYLSELLGIPLVEGSDLYVGANGRVWARAMDDDFEVDLIYRRVEDLELFVPGLTEAYLNHKVVLVNAMGTGASDDMDSAYRNRLAEQLFERPQAFIAQETLDFSRHLVFDDLGGEFQERYVDLRVFAILDGDGEIRPAVAVELKPWIVVAAQARAAETRRE